MNAWAQWTISNDKKMRYTLQVRTRLSNHHEHFIKLENLLKQIDAIITYVYNGSSLVFAKNEGEIPEIHSQVVLTVYDDSEILCPVSEGGTWKVWDDYVKNKV